MSLAGMDRDPEPGDEPRHPGQRNGRVGVELGVDLHGAKEVCAGVARNISTDGVFVATSEPLPVGARLLLLLGFAGERGPLAVRAEVRWTRPTGSVVDARRPAGMGLRFVDPPLGVVLAITDLIEQGTRD
jgi:uncharacterized protein (TIGR02266 family)